MLLVHCHKDTHSKWATGSGYNVDGHYCISESMHVATDTFFVFIDIYFDIICHVLHGSRG